MLLHDRVLVSRLSVGGVGAGCEVEVAGRFGQVEGGEDGLVAAGQGGTLGDTAVCGGQGDQVHAVEFVAQVAPGITGAGFGDPDEQQCQPTQLDVSTDAVLAVVIDRAQPERALGVTPTALDGEQLLVGGGQVLGGQRRVGGAQQPRAVVVGFAVRGGAVDAQQPSLGAPQQPAQPGLGLQRADQLVATAVGPGIGPGDQAGQVLDEAAADGGVAGGRVGVVAEDEPFGAGPLGGAAAG